MPRMGLEDETHASAEHNDACPSMRTARLSSRLLAQPFRLFGLATSRQTPPDDRTAGSRSPKSSVSATGRSYDASRFGSRSASEETTHISPRPGGALAQDPDARYRSTAAPAWACHRRLGPRAA